MGDLEFIQSIGIMIICATILVLMARLVRMPSIVVYIFAGLLLGPVLGVVEFEGFGGDDHHHSPMKIVSELGIVLLLFLVGLELNVQKIKDVGKVAILAGLGQVVFTAVGGFFIAWAIDFTVQESIVLAIALTFSSTVVVVKLLDQKGELQSLYGRIAVGIFLVQDLVVVIMLTILAGMGMAEEEAGSGQMAINLTWAFLGMGLLLLVAMLASKYLLAKIFTWVASSPTTLFIWGLFWCFLFVVGAEKLGLSLEIGAFLAGISLAQLRSADDLRRRVHPLMNFFIVIFFISLGGAMDLSAAVNDWWRAGVLSLFVLIGNPFIFMWIIAKSGYSERTSFFTSVTVAQISEFSFIFAAMAMATGLVGDGVLSIIMVVGLVTIVGSAYMILFNQPLYAAVRWLGLLKMFRAIQTPEVETFESLSNHVVIVGMNPLGRRLAEEIHRRGETVLAIDTDARKLENLPCATMVGNIDYPSVFEEAGLPHAKLGITALQIQDTNNLFVYRCREAGVPVAAHAFDRSVLDELNSLGADYLIDTRTESAKQIAVQLFSDWILGPIPDPIPANEGENQR